MSFECTMCSEAFTDTGANLPRILRSCGHTFCDACLRQAAGEGASIVCPTCASKTLLSGQGVSELSRAYALLEHMKLVGAVQAPEVPMCETCAEVSADNWCQECRVVECGSCSDKEHAGRTGRTHSRVPWTPKLDCSAATCVDHPQFRLDLVCRDCQDVSVCYKCVYSTDHRKHTTDLVTDAGEKAKDELRARMKVFGVPQLKVARATAALSTVLQTLCGASATFDGEGKAVSAADDDEGTAAVARRKIQHEFDVLTLALQERRSQLFAQVDAIEQEKRQCLESQLSALTTNLTTRYQLQHTAQRILEAPPATFMRDRPDLDFLPALEQVSLPCLGSAVDADISVEFAGPVSFLEHGQVIHVSPAQRACMLAEDAELLATMATVNLYGDTPLHIAARDGKLEALRELLRVGAAVDARGRSQYTALIYAAHKGHAAAVEALLAAGAVVDAKAERGETALLFAAWHGHMAAVQFLLAAGASPEAKNRNGQTALWLATARRCTGIVALLSAAGATM